MPATPHQRVKLLYLKEVITELSLVDKLNPVHTKHLTFV